MPFQQLATGSAPPPLLGRQKAQQAHNALGLAPSVLCILRLFAAIRVTWPSVSTLSWGLVVSSLGLSACTGPETVARPPRLELNETTHHAGRVRQGDPVNHAFVFRNRGERDLRISRVRASCDCTATGPRDAVEPDATGEIPVSFDTTAQFGSVARTVTVFSNDPSAPAVLLKLTADIEFDVAASPTQIYVGRVHPGDEVRVLGRVALAGNTEVVRIESPGAVADARLVGAPTDAGAWEERRLQVRIREQAPPGAFSEVVTIHTTSARTPVLTVPIVGVVEEKA